MDPTFAWGTAYDDQDARVLGSMRAQRLHAACVAHRDFDVVELRYCDLPNVGRCDVIVARCTNQEVPSHNTVGIKVVEILALAVPVGDHAPRVVALRRCFPLVSHLNEIVPGGPKSLCISDESWNDARRTWTPQRFLAGVLRWLTRTARGTLHAPDQPVERIYFESPLEVVLPAGYSGEGPANTRLVMSEVPRGQGRTFVASYKTDEDAGRVEVLPIYMEVERLHGVVDSVPVTLGELEDQWAARGTPIASRLVEKLARLAGGGIIDVLGQGLLLILDIGIVREAGTSAERREHIGFLIEQSLASLAHEMGAVFRSNRMHFAPSEPDPEAAQKSAEAWRPIRMLPVDVKAALTRSQAREQAGIDAQGADDERVLIGVGALGSALAEIWSREGWGRWTFVDPDHVQPHNLVRHRAVYADLGQFKVDVVKDRVDGVYGPQHVERAAVAIPGSATSSDNEALLRALDNASLVVDVSTTFDVPRELSSRERCRRMVSAFMTPSGGTCVALLEDEARTVPLHCLEPQYYRAILRNKWGETHLLAPTGKLVVGAGCRDVSAVISPELVDMHAAILARQVRVLSSRSEAALRVWILGDDGGVVVHDVRVHRAGVFKSATWRVILDDDLMTTLSTLRTDRVPSETGGIIVGYTDHFAQTMYVVDVLPAPVDSVEEPSGFVRGAEGLRAKWQDIQRRTAGIVTYIGEWHSHPPRHGAAPSADDLTLVSQIGDELAQEGNPAVMIIIAQEELGIFVCESDGTVAKVSTARFSE